METKNQREAGRLILSKSLSNRRISALTDFSPNTVRRYRKVLGNLGIAWSDLDKKNDREIACLFDAKRTQGGGKRMPDWSFVHKLMQNKNQTLAQLWEEYCIDSPIDAYGYSQFTHYYRQHSSKLDLTMRQTHLAGECIYVDYAGKTINWTDPDTGLPQKAQVFVGVFGCSNYTFAYASKSQKIEDWIAAHVAMLSFFGGIPEVIVPDNLKSAVIKAGNIPELNRTYADLARHYDCVIAPARVRKPQDKSKAELGVQLVSRWITAPLNRRKFFSVEEINDAILELLIRLNNRPFKRLPGCRYSRFYEFDRPLLRPLPAQLFEYAEWVHAQKVGPDYHVYVAQHAYSVPYTFVGKKVEARVAGSRIELFHLNKRIASHKKSDCVGGHTTNPAHRPISHQIYAEQSQENYLTWAKTIGPAAEVAISYQFKNKPDQSLLARKACSQLKTLARLHGNHRFEAACDRAQMLGSLTFKSISSILKRKIDETEIDMPIQSQLPFHHNVRGPDYYSVGGPPL